MSLKFWKPFIIVAVISAALYFTLIVVTPALSDRRVSQERLTACRAIVEQVRRQVDNPGSVTFVDCKDPSLANFTNKNVIFQDADDSDIWHYMGYYTDTFTSEAVMFSASAWETMRGWEADVYIFNHVR